VVAWRLPRGPAQSNKLKGTDEDVTEVAFSPDGRTTAWSDRWSLLVRTGSDPPVHLPIARASPAHEVMSLAFSPDGRWLASGGFDGTLALWDVASRQMVWPKAVQAHRLPVEAMAFSTDGKMLATAAVGSADYDDTVHLWDVQTGRELPPALSGHGGPVRAVAFSPDGKMLACAASERVVFWDLDRHQCLGEAAANAAQFVTSLAFSPDGRWLASGGFDDRAMIWDLRTEAWRQQACAVANRTLNEREWQRLMGDSPYRKSCP